MKDLKKPKLRPENRLLKARRVFVRLKRIWRPKNILRRTKLRLYKTLVLAVLLYGCETWGMVDGRVS